MGTTFNQIIFASDLVKANQQKSTFEVMDIGRQEIFQDLSPNTIRYELQQKGIHISESELNNLSQSKDVAQIFKLLGVNYSALDIYKHANSILFDLNLDSVPQELHNKFDLVRNLGTTEHVFNQYNSFLTIHNLTAVGGYMQHNLPTSHFWGHGFFKYDPKFFLMLAKINNYKIISHALFDDNNSPESRVKSIAKVIFNRKTTKENRHIASEFIFQKTCDQAFQIPLDLDINQGIEDEILSGKYAREIA